MAKNLNINSVGSKFFTGATETTVQGSENVKIIYVEKAPETKSKRLQLLIKPSIFEALKKRADTENNSVNNLINQILEESIKK